MRPVIIRLPRLTGETAYMTAFVLEEICHAIWREYSDDMANFQGRVFPDGPPDYDPPDDPLDHWPGDDSPY